MDIARIELATHRVREEHSTDRPHRLTRRRQQIYMKETLRKTVSILQYQTHYLSYPFLDYRYCYRLSH